MKNILVTTTNNIEGHSVLQYLGPVYSNIVVGTNIFSDISASFSDIFGGRSETYQKKLELIRNQAVEEIKKKASSLGANAVLSLHLDFDEISGGGKSMFMVSASGTACMIAYENKSNEITIASEAVEEELTKIHILQKIRNRKPLNEYDFEYLSLHPLNEAVSDLISIYIEYQKDTTSYKGSIGYMESVLKMMPYDLLCEEVYKKLGRDDDPLFILIDKIHLFHPKKIMNLIKGNIHLGIYALQYDKAEYTADDIENMKEIIKILDSLPATGKIEVVKSGVFGKEQSKYICMNGHKSDPDSIYCENVNCRVNIKGLTEKEIDIIVSFKDRVMIIDKLLKSGISNPFIK